MRYVIRPSVRLPVLEQIKREYAAKINEIRDQGGPPEGKWGDPQVRGAIYASHGRICAFCQRMVSDTRGDVEHFRPKNVYRWLMYEFSNLLLACRICNSNRKGSRFPLADDSQRVAYASDPRLGSRLQSEPRLLLDPALDPVEAWVTVTCNEAQTLCRVAPGDQLDQTASDRVGHTIRFFRLNLSKEFVKDRTTRVFEALELADKATDGDNDAMDAVRRMASRFKPHGMAVRRMLEERVPAIALPTREEEVTWYVVDVIGDADFGVALRPDTDPGSPEREDLDKKLSEDYWALAVLWKFPPKHVDPQVIEGLIRASRHQAEVRTRYDQI